MTNRSRKIRLFAALGIALIGAYILADWYTVIPADRTPQFVGRDQCVRCHADQADAFRGSHHDRAMDLATEQTVLGHFDGSTVEHAGVTSRFFRDGKRFMVNTEGPDGQMQDFEVKYVFGVEPLQQYMVEMQSAGGTQVESRQGLTSNAVGQVQVLRLSWDVPNGKWFYLEPPDVASKLDPNDPLHWTGSTQCWNTSCASCHSTNLIKDFDPLSATFTTTFSEMDVSCEACHGPGSLHVAMAEGKSLFWDRQQGYGLNRLKGGTNFAQVETCAPCHSRRGELASTWHPGAAFDEAFRCQLIQEPTYFADGQIRDEDYVYGSFIQSKMYANNIRCTDCHDPHSLKLKYTDNQLCTSCHQHTPEKYDSPAHHFHKPGSAGASCVECHMPSTTYMAIDARRDHSLRVPRPDLSVELGTPNACTGCHLDATVLPETEQGKLTQYLDWIEQSESGNEVVAAELDRVNAAMARAFDDWYGAKANALRTPYYEQLARLLTADPQSSREPLQTFLNDYSVPAMIRASGLMHLAGDRNPATLALAKRNLNSPDLKVATAALQCIEAELQRSGPAETEHQADLVTRVGELLDHASSRLRLEAVRVLVFLPAEIRQLCRIENFSAKLDRATDRWLASLNSQNDRAASHMMMGEWYLTQNKINSAADAFRTAIRVEPNTTGPRSNLAQLLESQLQALQQRLEREANGSSPQAVASLLAEAERLANEVQRLRSEEHALLATDIQRSQGLANTDYLHYRFAMSCYLMGDLEGLQEHLLIAHEMRPGNETYLVGLVAMSLQRNDREQALVYARRLAELFPENRDYRRQVEELSR